MIKLSVVIATYNRADNLLRTLRSLMQQDLDRELWEIVIINNNCVDHTAQMCEKFAAENPTLNFSAVIETQQGLSFARNRGIEQACGEYIVNIDDDEEVNREFLSAYYNFFEANPDAIACGGVVEPLYEFEVPSWLSYYSERPIAGTVRLGPNIRPFPRGLYPTGGNMAFRRVAFTTYGLYDVALGRKGQTLMGGEEKDFFLRLRAAGHTIYYIPSAVMYHIIPQSRVTKEYLNRVTKMIGCAERVRTLNLSKYAYFKRLLSECVKWGGTFALLVILSIRGRPSAGMCLVRMRLNISGGLLTGKF